MVGKDGLEGRGGRGRQAGGQIGLRVEVGDAASARAKRLGMGGSAAHPPGAARARRARTARAPAGNGTRAHSLSCARARAGTGRVPHGACSARAMANVANVAATHAAQKRLQEQQELEAAKVAWDLERNDTLQRDMLTQLARLGGKSTTAPPGETETSDEKVRALSLSFVPAGAHAGAHVRVHAGMCERARPRVRCLARC